MADASSPYIDWHFEPDVHDPIVVIAFEGWNDAGNAASEAARFLEVAYDATPFAEISAEEFFDFTSIRPIVEFSAAGERRIQWPSTTMSVAPKAVGERDIIIIRGIEPQLRWRTFCKTILDVLQSYNTSLVVTFGALLADVPHTRETVVYSTTAGPTRPEVEGFEVSKYEGMTGIIGVLHSALTVRGVTYGSLWGAVPTYVPSTVSPKAAAALVVRLRDMFSLDIDLTSLEKQAAEYTRHVQAYVQDEPEMVQFVQELEAHYDAQEKQAPGNLIAEVERFLRERRD